MGMAPALAEQLAQAPNLLDDLLSPDFFAPLPQPVRAGARSRPRAQLAHGYEDTLIRLRRWVRGANSGRNPHPRDVTDGIGAGVFLAGLAELTLVRLLPAVEGEFAARHGRSKANSHSRMGRLGGKLMSFSSDLDLIAIYRAAEGAASDGDKPAGGGVYYTRLTQRLVAALSAPMPEGRLYHVDLRLRPSGEAGPVAAAFAAFRRYHAKAPGPGSTWR